MSNTFSVLLAAFLIFLFIGANNVMAAYLFGSFVTAVLADIRVSMIKS